MIIQLLGTAFILAFTAIAIFGHVLLVQAAFTPKAGKSESPANAPHIGRNSPVRGSRRSVGSDCRSADAFFTRSSSSLMRRTSFATQ